MAKSSNKDTDDANGDSTSAATEQSGKEKTERREIKGGIP
jgi:hypothetical protein